jgi:hypothetical protein
LKNPQQEDRSTAKAHGDTLLCGVLAEVGKLAISRPTLANHILTALESQAEIPPALVLALAADVHNPVTAVRVVELLITGGLGGRSQ